MLAAQAKQGGLMNSEISNRESPIEAKVNVRRITKNIIQQLLVEEDANNEPIFLEEAIRLAENEARLLIDD